MFEKLEEEIEVKADEYALEESTACDYGESSKHVYQGYFYGFKKGAEFGYNKANEWHDLRKNPNDLPNEFEIVVCYCLGYCGVSYPITARLYIDYEDSSVHRWWTIAGEGHSEQLNNVIAWKEIVLPKEIKEND